MLTKTMKYYDFDGNERVEELQFHLTKVELMEMAMELPDEISSGIGNDPSKIDDNMAARLLKTLGGKGVLDFIKKLVLKAYGTKSFDGRRFEKSEQLSTQFSQTLAFEALVEELMTDDQSANEFINGVIASKIGK